jgi:hypothetical protein
VAASSNEQAHWKAASRGTDAERGRFPSDLLQVCSASVRRPNAAIGMNWRQQRLTRKPLGDSIPNGWPLRHARPVFHDKWDASRINDVREQRGRLGQNGCRSSRMFKTMGEWRSTSASHLHNGARFWLALRKALGHGALRQGRRKYRWTWPACKLNTRIIVSLICAYASMRIRQHMRKFPYCHLGGGPVIEHGGPNLLPSNPAVQRGRITLARLVL